MALLRQIWVTSNDGSGEPRHARCAIPPRPATRLSYGHRHRVPPPYAATALQRRPSRPSQRRRWPGYRHRDLFAADYLLPTPHGATGVVTHPPTLPTSLPHSRPPLRPPAIASSHTTLPPSADVAREEDSTSDDLRARGGHRHPGGHHRWRRHRDFEGGWVRTARSLRVLTGTPKK